MKQIYLYKKFLAKYLRGRCVNDIMYHRVEDCDLCVNHGFTSCVMINTTVSRGKLQARAVNTYKKVMTYFAFA